MDKKENPLLGLFGGVALTFNLSRQLNSEGVRNVRGSSLCDIKLDLGPFILLYVKYPGVIEISSCMILKILKYDEVEQDTLVTPGS